MTCGMTASFFFTNGNNQKVSYKSYSLDARVCMDISYCSSANKVELIEYQIDVATGIKEVRSQTLDVCSYGYHVMSGDGNTLVFSDEDGYRKSTVILSLVLQ